MWRINSVEEITTTTTEEYSDDEEYNDLPALTSDITTTKVPFPEAGIDLIDTQENHSDNNGDVLLDRVVKCTDLHNWEENWLFRKKKKNDCKSEIMLEYMAMVLSEVPVCMLIPNPIDKLRASVGERDIDELSELSEHNSYGSLEFSDDETEDEELIECNTTSVKELTNEKKPDSSGERVATNKAAVMKTRSDENNECNEPKAMRSAIVGSDRYKNKPNVKLIAKVPNFMPKELRDKTVSAQSDPYLVLIPGDASVQSGILVQFCCRAKGTKPLYFSWFKNDTILKSDQNYRIFQSGEENVLEIKKTSVEDSAHYSCVAYNRFGYHWCDFTLEVRPHESNDNNMPTTNRVIKTDIPSKSKGVFSTNPKHETHKTYKTRPFVVQRTWAERVAELKIINSRAQSNQETSEEKNQQNDNNLDYMSHTPEPHLPMTPTIAEREHRKWENPDIELNDNNPYSVENLNTRRQQRSLRLSEMSEETQEVIEEQIVEEEDEVDTSFLSSKSKDLSRYKKDYYVKSNKDETLRSLDENVYSNSKYFELRQSTPNLSENSSKSVLNGVESHSNPNEALGSQSNGTDSQIAMPSVKDLVNRFATKEENDCVPKLVDVKRKSSFSDSKLNFINNNCNNNSNNCKNASTWQNNHSNFKVHSLTARSLTKEFREMSQLNLPRTQRNRMDIYSQNHSNSLNESESSNPSTPCSPTNEGYASDESNASSVVSSGAPPVPPPVLNNKPNNERKFSRSILRRASYWEKRCEKGLISDSSVNEDFPPMEKFAN